MWIILYSFLAGVLGMGIGGVIGGVFGDKTKTAFNILLSLAAGVMLSLIFFSLIPESFELTGSHLIMLSSVIGGVALIFLAKIVLDALHAGHHHCEACKTKKPPASHTAVILIIAMSLHNIPEGIAIGAVGNFDLVKGIILASLIAVHNLPEGALISAPLTADGVSRKKAVLTAALTGATTVVGTIIGVFIGQIGDTATGVCLGTAAGSLLYITFDHILPEVMQQKRGIISTVCVLAGILGGYCLTLIG